MAERATIDRHHHFRGHSGMCHMRPIRILVRAELFCFYVYLLDPIYQHKTAMAEINLWFKRGCREVQVHSRQ